MDKCWFVLPQTHYPPPQEEDENGAVKQTGPICLGHFIKSLKHLDQVINSSGPEPFPLDMSIYRTKPTNFEWEENKERELSLSATAEVPVAAAPGITAKTSLGFAIKKTVGNYWQIDELETAIVQPSRAYINRCLASDSVAEFLQHAKLGPTWSIFMITGLKIAHGNSIQKVSRGRERGTHGGPGLGVTSIAEASIEGGISSGTSVSMSTEYTHDFVWAVRLSKITKGLFDKKWSQKTFSKGATFDMSEGSGSKEDLEAALSDEGLLNSQVLSVDSSEGGHEVFVI
ncbi:hypothetical protein AK830_g8088 [Neonectria ditissima]|uniref:Uncharacterized protein n=1 Tax=Neonectria ditissima TaxID=78410 RepID=A0A0P7BEZ1_9HYPO|nr:hypothetical protein AK830_g8088 [Neonectria ditissima]